MKLIAKIIHLLGGPLAVQEDLRQMPPPVLHHWLVGPSFQDALDYVRLHKYDRARCLHVKSELDVCGQRPPAGSLKIHYLRGWDKLPLDLLARLRVISKNL